ncbi:MAG: ATPase [Oleiphilaceae bacterium]|nr:ATPase [Oleiphilaceae bacterium]
MEITTFGELIEWTREQHSSLARCLDHYAARHEDERSRGLLAYLARHESEIEWMVADFKRQGDEKALNTTLYDYLSSPSHHAQSPCGKHFLELDFDGICREVLDFHNDVIQLYQLLLRKALIPEVEELISPLLEMERSQAKLMAQQVVLMTDL